MRQVFTHANPPPKDLHGQDLADSAMASYKSGNGSSANGSMHLDLTFTKTPDRPTFSYGRSIEGNLTLPCFGQRVPIVAIGFDNQLRLLEHEVRLKAPGQISCC